MTAEQVILKGPDIDRILTRMTHEILEKHRLTEDLVLIGIHTGGVFLADRVLHGTAVAAGRTSGSGTR